MSETPDPNDFGEVFVGTTVNNAGTLSNSEPGMQGYTSVVEVGTGCDQLSMTPVTGSVQGGTGEPITVTFSPTSRGTKSCRFDLMNAAVLVGSFSATGIGIERVITLAATTSFGQVRVANATTLTASRTLIIGNTGNTPLDVTDITITGDYTLAVPPSLPSTIGVNGTLNIEVVFDPSAAGTRTGNFTVTSNDQSAPTIVSMLSGEGTNARIGVADVNFNTVNNGTTVTRQLVVSNTAAAPVGTLRVTKGDIAGGSWFKFAANGSANCAGLTSCTFAPLAITTTANVDVNCTPAPNTVTGTQTATVTFTSDTDGGGVNVANLSCTAGRSDVTVSVTSLTFGDQRVNTDSTAQTFTINNTGNIAATYSVAKTGADAPHFNITGCATTGSVPATNGVVTCTVTFRPTSLGGKTIGITVTNNDPDAGDGSKVISPVTGTGVAPQISAPATLDLGVVDIGSSSGVQTLTITNTGSQQLAISSATINPANAQFTIMSGLTGAQVVATGGTAQWTFTCTPTTQGAFTATFRILSDSLTGATTNVSLGCNGQRGVLVVSPTSINFGPVPQNMSQQRTFTLQNTGNLPVTGITATLSSMLVGYSIDASTPVPTTLGAGASSSLIKVNFAPMSGNDGGMETITFAGMWTGTATHATTAVLQLDGDGLSADVNVSPATLPFGEFRWNTPQNQTFCILNGSQFSVTIMDIAINPVSPTVTGEFTRGQMKRQTTCGVGGTVVTGQPVLLTQEVLEVTITATPASRVGMMAADVTITTNLATNPTRHVMLTGTSTSGAITVSTMDLDLGAVDVDAGAITQMVTITNTGQASFNLSGFAASAEPSIGLTLPAATALAPGDSVTIGVTYDPSVVATHSTTVTHSIANILGGPTVGTIMIHGRGIDRSFDAAPLEVVFPDTFRNPGSMAPTVDVTVSNLGEAVLHVSGVMVVGEVFTLVEPTAAIDIPGLGSHVFKVAFSPTMAGMAPDGVLQLMTDDDMRLMAEIPLRGMGMNRNVTINPTDSIDLGYTGVGIPVTIPDVLQITSMDSTHAFKIRKIELVDAGPFTVENAPEGAGIDLPPAGQQTFGVSFAATSEGFFETTAYIYLDEDDQPHGMVTIRGNAVFVDLQGGGGCSTGAGTSGGAVLLLGALALARRRRRGRVIGALPVALALASPALAEPENPTNLDVGVFNPTPSTITGFFQVQTADVGANGDWVASGRVSYATNPLVARTSVGDATLIGQRTMFDLGGAYAFLDRFEAGARMPIYSQDGSTATTEPVNGLTAAKGTALGDLTVHGKVRLVNAAAVIVGTSLHLTLPTATDGQYTGIDGPSARLMLLGSFLPHKRLTITVNAGGVLRQESESGNITQGSGLAWGGSVSFRALDSLWIAGEVFGEMVPSGHATLATNGSTMVTKASLSPMEGLLGVNYRVERRITLGAAIGRGLSNSLGSPELRGVFGITFAPGTPELPPIHKPPPPRIDGDADADGLKDSKDKCPSEAEDFDQFDDSDGCPDLDNDTDGVTDDKDKCPLDGEDRDKFQDEDGCPDKDNDSDGFADDKDKCPDRAEDKDNFQDTDGCPDLDNDTDGITDDKDRCVNEPETINGIQDDDGCPDKGDSVVVVSPDRLETLEAVQFTGTKITKPSFNVLGQVAATLRAHPEIIRIRVTTHMQPTTNVAKDQETSDKRAQVVRDWLIQWGIASSRIEARGFGGTRTLVAPDQRGAAQINDRLELIILERK